MGDTITNLIHKLLEAVIKKRHHIKVTSLYLSERIFNIAVAFVTYTFFVRAYGPSLVGEFSYSQTVMGFAVPFLAAGSEAIVIRELVRGTHSRGEVMGSAFTVLSIVGLIATLAPLAFIGITHGHEETLWRISLFTALGFIPSGLMVAEQALKADVSVVPVVATRAIAATISAVAKLFAIIRGYPIESVAAITAVEAILLSGLLLWAYRRSGHSVRSWRLSTSYAIFLLKQSLPPMIASVTIMLFFRANHVLLVFLSDFRTVGQYAVAFQVVQLFIVLPYVFFGAAYPRLVHLHATDPARYDEVINMCYVGFAVVGYLIIAFNFFFAKILFDLFFGSRYGVASEIIVILSVANLFTFMGAVRGQIINISNATHYHVLNAVVGLAVVLPVSFLLIPKYGAIGASWSIAAASFVSGVLTSFMIPATRSSGIAQIRALLFVPTFRGSA